MTQPPRRAVDPPFSPVLLAGLALAPLPPRLLQPVVDAVFSLVRRRHPDLLDRLSPYGDAVIGLDPVDLPYVLIFRPDPERPTLTVARDFSDVEIKALVRGPFLLLSKLGEGQLDGDAAFFSRQLVVEGETELVVALRNAVDGAAIDLIEDIAAAMGPLGGLFKRSLSLGGSLFEHFAGNMDMVRRSISGPVQKASEAQAARIAELETEVAALRRQARQRGAKA